MTIPPPAASESVEPAAPLEAGRRGRRRGPPIEPGTRFRHWTVLYETELSCNAHPRRQVLCRCDCGAERTVMLCTLRDGRSTRCAECAAKASWAARRSACPQSAARSLHFVGYVASSTGPLQSALRSSWNDAVAWLASVCALDARRASELKRDGYVRLGGAAYVEIVRCDCATPHVHSETAEAAQ